jgi:hypothetical protein
MDGTHRLCVDHRKLKNITIKNRYLSSNIGELQDRLPEAKYFTKLDLRGAYNQIRMKAEEEWKTAFRTRYGLYEYTIMSLELTNAPTTCQETINDALRQYLDLRNMYSMSPQYLNARETCHISGSCTIVAWRYGSLMDLNGWKDIVVPGTAWVQ